MKILAIETSCDETSVAVVENGQKVLSLVVNSQIDLHAAFGGVVPEVAARSHIEVMIPVVQQALEEAFADSSESPTLNTKYWDQIDAIAVTQGPGLLGSLLIGVLTARTLAWSLNKPLIPVHHILGHVYANWITGGDNLTTPHSPLPTSAPKFPVLALIVSGGHTQLMYAEDHDDWRVIGRTTDDAVGEAFDKAAKLLGLPYPGGVSLSKIAQSGDADSYHLPTPKVSTVDQGLLDLRAQILELRGDANGSYSQLDWESSKSQQVDSNTKAVRLDGKNSKIQDLRSKISYNFSFSGLKTAFLRAVQEECGKSHDFPSFELAALLSEAQKANFAASIERTAINYLVSHTKAAFEEFQPKTFILGGGVAASLPLRSALSEALPIEISYPPQILCTDNAVMIGARAFFQVKNKDPVDPKSLEVRPSWPL